MAAFIPEGEFQFAILPHFAQISSCACLTRLNGPVADCPPFGGWARIIGMDGGERVKYGWEREGRLKERHKERKNGGGKQNETYNKKK